MNASTYTIPPYSDEYLAQVARVVGVALLLLLHMYLKRVPWSHQLPFLLTYMKNYVNC